jgi:uncharacterized protein (TIGR01244 family)
MSKLKLFLLSFFLTTLALAAVIYIQRPKLGSDPPPELVRIADDLFLTSQLKSEDIRPLRYRGIRTIVDMRPDGEAVDQTPSAEIGDAAKRIGLSFHYIPVPHESLPESDVQALSEVLSHDDRPAVLYCRTGRRAVRLFALVEASRVDGPSTDAILGMVRAAGFSADDLRDDIVQRLAHRNGASAANK